MTRNPPALLEVKFACPHCAQHIACDPAYCGTRIECPSCRCQMMVPRLSAFDSPPIDDLSPSLISEEEWDQRVTEWSPANPLRIPGSITLQSWFWFFFLGPLLLFFAGGGLEFRWLAVSGLQIIFGICAVVAGFLLAKASSTDLAGFILGGILFTFLIVAADAFVCFFGGCAMACSQAATGAR
jgi:hypothetical protein